MASLKKYKPITNGQRHRILLLKEQLTKENPLKALTKGLTKNQVVIILVELRHSIKEEGIKENIELSILNDNTIMKMLLLNN